MRVGVTSRYNNDTLPLLRYMAERLGVSAKDAQRAAVVAMAREMIARDRAAATEAKNANATQPAPTDGAPAAEGDGAGAPSGDDPGAGAPG